jgi:hypothetical protein
MTKKGKLNRGDFMEEKKRALLIKLLVAVILGSCVLLASCAPEIHMAKSALLKDPRHKDNIPEMPACPIDGLWKDSFYGYKFGIEKGRLFDRNPIIVQGHNMGWPMVSVKDIVRVAPGKYRGKSMAGSGGGWKPCTLTVVERNKLIQKVGGKTIQVYEYLSLFNPKWFHDDFKAMQVAALRARSGSSSNKASELPAKPSLELQGVEIKPRAIKPGGLFDIEFKYIASDSSKGDKALPVKYQYKILVDKKVLLKSDPSVIRSGNGLLMTKVIKLEGSTKKGVYAIEVIIGYKDLVKNGTAELIVCENPPKTQPEPVEETPPKGTQSTSKVKPDPGSLGLYRFKYGSIFYFRVTGRLSGSLYGTDIYTDDSQLGVAAVHAGVLRPGETGIVKVNILPGQRRYPGCSRNGVTSRSWGRWDCSYTVAPAE